MFINHDKNKSQSLFHIFQFMAKISNLIPAASEKPEDQEEEKEKPIVVGGYFARLDILSFI